jgi:hypothetical protein
VPRVRVNMISDGEPSPNTAPADGLADAPLFGSSPAPGCAAPGTATETYGARGGWSGPQASRATRHVPSASW